MVLDFKKVFFGNEWEIVTLDRKSVEKIRGITKSRENLGIDSLRKIRQITTFSEIFALF